MTQPARLENVRTLDPHSHAALTDRASRLGPSREMHEPALDIVCELRMLLVGGCLWLQGPKEHGDWHRADLQSLSPLLVAHSAG